MSFQTVQCTLCGASTSKRKSLVVEPYGRICRSHPEVEAHLTKLQQLRQEKLDGAVAEEKLRKGIEAFQVLMAVEAIRTGTAMGVVDIETALARVERTMKPAQFEQVLKQLIEKGPLTEKELNDAVMTAVMLRMKGFGGLCPPVTKSEPSSVLTGSPAA